MATAKPTVFVLDDDAAIRDSLSQLIKLMGLPTELFSTASEFLAAYDPSRPGCLLLDLRLPGDGIELLKTLGDSDGSLSLIVIAGHGDSATRDKATELGAVAFFEKPFNSQELCECIRQVIEPETETR